MLTSRNSSGGPEPSPSMRISSQALCDNLTSRRRPLPGWAGVYSVKSSTNLNLCFTGFSAEPELPTTRGRLTLNDSALCARFIVVRVHPTDVGETYVDGSSDKRVVLLCRECGERTVLVGPLSLWLSGSTSFGCECGKHLSLAYRLVGS